MAIPLLTAQCGAIPSTCLGEWARTHAARNMSALPTLKAEHDKLVEQRNRKEERERLALRRKEAYPI